MSKMHRNSRQLHSSVAKTIIKTPVYTTSAKIPKIELPDLSAYTSAMENFNTSIDTSALQQRLTEINDLMNEIQKSVSTNYSKEREEYKNRTLVNA
ncbi:hypothetical protein [Cytobacillus gottheilii]|uniref:hypothetical protein n=1 Tax=Cytobacillus gottheilii TaxID=859144 RepID=UPI000835679F|nr:hypothetical protein [Cytobacillus gottheilii]